MDDQLDYLLLVECEGKSHVVTFNEFCRANADDPELIEDVKCLAKGFGWRFKPTA